jgi:hypothetical protein
MYPQLQERLLDRRNFFGQCGLRLGSVALASACREALHFSAITNERPNPLAPRPTHFPAKAKNVIYLFMVSGPKSARPV